MRSVLALLCSVHFPSLLFLSPFTLRRQVPAHMRSVCQSINLLCTACGSRAAAGLNSLMATWIPNNLDEGHVCPLLSIRALLYKMLPHQQGSVLASAPQTLGLNPTRGPCHGPPDHLPHLAA